MLRRLISCRIIIIYLTPGLLQRSQHALQFFSHVSSNGHEPLTALKPDIDSESKFLPTPPAFDAPRKGGFRQNIATPFGMEKLEWCGYQMVKKFRHVYSF